MRTGKSSNPPIYFRCLAQDQVVMLMIRGPRSLQTNPHLHSPCPGDTVAHLGHSQPCPSVLHVGPKVGGLEGHTHGPVMVFQSRVPECQVQRAPSLSHMLCSMPRILVFTLDHLGFDGVSELSQFIREILTLSNLTKFGFHDWSLLTVFNSAILCSFLIFTQGQAYFIF